MNRETRHSTLQGATVKSVQVDGGLIYMTLGAGLYDATILVRAVETKWESRPDYCETCDHFNPLGALGEPCEHGV